MKPLNLIKLVGILAIALFLLGSSSEIPTDKSKDVMEHGISIAETVLVIQPCHTEVNSSISKKDCTVTIKNDDMDIELTLHNVGRWECFKLKVKALWANITGDI